jgi:regulator of sigma D
MKNNTAKNQVQSLHSKQQLEKANQIFETISAHTESKNKFLDLLTKNFL